MHGGIGRSAQTQRAPYDRCVLRTRNRLRIRDLTNFVRWLAALDDFRNWLIREAA
jgi:hypothetical protein